MDYSIANPRESAAGLLRGRLRCRCSGATGVFAAPRASLGAIENTVVVGVHLIKPGSCPLCGPLLGTLDVLLAGDGTATRRRGGR